MALGWKVTKHQGGTLTIKGPGHSAIRLRDGALIPQTDGASRVYDTEMQLAAPYRGTGLARQNGYQIGEDVCCLLATDVVAVPDAAPTSARDAANAALDKVAGYTLSLKG